MGKLMGKTALIMDALQGIDEGTTRIFTCHGANLILLDISLEIEKLADELCGHGHRCMAVIVDVCDPVSVVAAIKCAKEKEGCIDILVNNAGICRLDGFFDMSDGNRDFHIDINIKGVWDVTKAVLSKMIARKGSRIVIMFSVTGDMAADPGETACALVKAAIVDLTKSSAAECVQSGVRVNVICPGYVRTPMAESIARQSNPEGPESVLTEMAKTVPMCRPVGPLEVGELAVFPVLDEPSYLVGTQNATDSGSILPGTASIGI